MEDIKAYIESGILELYAAGDLNPDERLGVEAMLAKYPEIRTDLTEIEKSLEQYAKAYALDPSAKLRNQIVSALSTGGSASDETAGLIGRTVFAARENHFFKYAFAASLALFILSLAAIVTLYSSLQKSRQQLAVVQDSNQQFSNRVNYMNEKLSDQDLAISVFRNPGYKMVKLAGTKQAPKASMMVAFNPAKKEVMIDMAAMEMPDNDTEHQYQLWAMVDGKPVDLGVFDMKPQDDRMKKMKAIGNAQAFAVTLEPRGGSESPTMAQIMVMGAI